MWVYILKSIVVEERFYVGLTDDPERRLSEHNAGESFHTKDYKPWKIISKFWFEKDDTAERFERYLKSGSGRAFAKRHLS